MEQYLTEAANRFVDTPIQVLRKVTKGLVYGELAVNTTNGLEEFNKLTEVGRANYLETLNAGFTNQPTHKYDKGTGTGSGTVSTNPPELEDFEPVNDEYPSPTEPIWVSQPQQGDRVLLFAD